MGNIFKRTEWDRNDFLQICLYQDFIQKDKDGWFGVDEIISNISNLRQTCRISVNNELNKDIIANMPLNYRMSRMCLQRFLTQKAIGC